MKKFILLFSIMACFSFIRANQQTVLLKKNEFVKLVKIADEYMLIAENKDVKIRYEKIDDKTYKFDLVIAEDLEFANDLIYSFHLSTENAQIVNVSEDGKAIVFTVGDEKEPVFSWQTFTYGLSSGIVTTLIIVLIIVL